MAFYIRNYYGQLWGKYISKKVPFNEEFVWESRAGLLDIDIFGHINNAMYFRLCEYARWAWAAAGGILDLWKGRKCGPVITIAAARYRRPIPFLTKYCIKSRLVHVNERAFYMTQKFYVKEKLHCSVLLELRVVSKSGPLNCIEQFQALLPNSPLPSVDTDLNMKQGLDLFHALEAVLLEKPVPELSVSPHISSPDTPEETKDKQE